MRRASTSALACLAFGIAGLTQASTHPSSAWNSVPSITVQVAGIDLSSEVGQRVLYRRLQGAAESACSHLDTSRSLMVKRQFRRCVKETITEAAAKVRHPAFLLYANSRLALAAGQSR
jgi:UrcA family protein